MLVAEAGALHKGPASGFTHGWPTRGAPGCARSCLRPPRPPSRGWPRCVERQGVEALVLCVHRAAVACPCNGSVCCRVGLGMRDGQLATCPREDVAYENPALNWATRSRPLGWLSYSLALTSGGGSESRTDGGGGGRRRRPPGGCSRSSRQEAGQSGAVSCARMELRLAYPCAHGLRYA
jgi:hypothetical protein